MESEHHAIASAADIAAMIGEPARARMLYCLMDGHARTSTELSAVADVGPSTASAHLGRLKAAGLVQVLVQGKHRYYSLGGSDVAAVLEGLHVLGGGTQPAFIPSTPVGLRAARTCYDHLAGAVGVSLHDRLHALGWLLQKDGPRGGYDLTPTGSDGLTRLGVDVEAARARRRRFACGCLDWSERRPHLGGALGAALLKLAIDRGWLDLELDSRSLTVTSRGRTQLRAHFGVCLEAG